MRGTPQITARLFTSLRRTAAVTCFVSLCLLSGAVAFGLTQKLDAVALSAMQAFASSGLDLFSSLVTVTGRAEVTAALACVLAFVWVRREGATGLAPLVLFAAVLIEAAFRYVVPHTPPPSNVLRDLNILQVVRSDAPYSFPSGHLVRTTLLAILIAERVPSSWLLLTLYIATMSITRVYVGAHWPSDVLGGILFGAAAGLVATPLAGRARRTFAMIRR